jgi:uncharacterized protein YfdQ (DUF2303 family)
MEPITNDVAAAVEAGKQAVTLADRMVALAPFTDDAIPVVMVRQGETVKPLAELVALQDERAPAPRRLRGTATFTELASFIAHVNRFKDGASVIFADTVTPTLTAVLDYSQGGGEVAPRWGQHRSVYTLPLSAKWQLWLRHDAEPMGQEAFAQFVEDHLEDIRSPSGDSGESDLPAAAELLTMARNLVIRSRGEFSRSINPVTGEYALVSKHENTSESTKIPRGFLLGIPVFEAGAPYALEARMRFSMLNARPTFAYALANPDEKVRDAFNEVRTLAEARTGLPVLAGSPE